LSENSGAAERQEVVQAEEADWGMEYSDLILSIKIVPNLDDALRIFAGMAQGTRKLSLQKMRSREEFMEEIDAAGVFHNASTRLRRRLPLRTRRRTGNQYEQIHARGPVGLEGLTTYKYKLFGNGQTVGNTRAVHAISHTEHFRNEQSLVLVQRVRIRTRV